MSVDATRDTEGASAPSVLFAHIDRLLDAGLGPIDRLNAATSLLERFAELAGAYGAADSATTAEPYTPLACGTAISPIEAARCIRDYLRTAAFMGGLLAAVEEARNRFVARPIHVIYAGCGPFATLAVPVARRLGPDEVRFTLIDAHRASLDSARRVLGALGLADSVRAYVEADAAEYEHDGAEVHVVVTETMGVALIGEPQVAVTRNLSRLLPAEGIFVPRRVTLDARLADIGLEQSAKARLHDAERETVTARMHAERVPLGLVFELVAGPDQPAGVSLLPPRTIQVPRIDEPLWPVLFTEIEVFPGLVLGEFESQLTTPYTLVDLGKLEGGEAVEFSYVVGPKPGPRYTRRAQHLTQNRER